MAKKLYGGYIQDYDHIFISQKVNRIFKRHDKDFANRLNTTQLCASLTEALEMDFNERLCDLLLQMISATDANIKQFQALYNYLESWLGLFYVYDEDRTDFLTRPQFARALKQLGYDLKDKTIVEIMCKVHGGCDKISLMKYLEWCIQLLRITIAFKQIDDLELGEIMVIFEECFELLLSILL